MRRKWIAALALGALFVAGVAGCGGSRGNVATGASVTYHHHFGPSPWRYGRDRIVVVPVPEEPELEAVPLPTPEPEMPDFELEAMPMGFPDD